MYKILTTAFVALTLAACGTSKKGVPVKLNQKTGIASSVALAEAMKVVSQNAGDNNINQSIRSSIDGISFSRSAIANNQVQINVEISANINYEQCAVSKFKAVGAAGNVDWISINGLGRARCIVDSSCSVVVLEINSLPGGQGGGSVPVILQKSKTGYVPQSVPQSSVFLNLRGDMNVMCLKPSQVADYLNAQPANPLGTYNPTTMPPTMDYFPDYNGWFE